ncbi:MAG: isoprenylcysteine carboxylmethyltransferase family protein [Micropepsaceae bacterium]
MSWMIPPLFVLVSISVMAVLAWLAPVAIVVSPPWNFAGVAVAAGGLALAASGSRLFRARGTNIHTFRSPDVLVETGLFAWSRNPMYLGFLIALLGAAVAMNAASAFAGPAMFFAAASLWYIPFEERVMRRTFGEAYDAYARRVRRWI